MSSNAVEFSEDRCSQKIALTEDLRAVIREMYEIHELELTAVTRNDKDAIQSEALRMKLANERKAALMSLLACHVADHGC